MCVCGGGGGGFNNVWERVNAFGGAVNVSTFSQYIIYISCTAFKNAKSSVYYVIV